MATTKAKKRPASMREPNLEAEPCPRCLGLAREGKLRLECVMPLPPGAMAPLAVDRSGKCCFDCAAADTVMRFNMGVPGFGAARIAVGNDRQEQFRLPGVPLGLVKAGLVRPSKAGDLERHLAWLGRQPWWRGTAPEGEE